MTLKLFVPPQGTEGNCGAAINTTGHSRPRPLAGSRSEPSVPTPRNARQVPKPRDSAEGLTKGGTRTQLSPRPLRFLPERAQPHSCGAVTGASGAAREAACREGKVCALRWLTIPGNPPGLAPGDSRPGHWLVPKLSGFRGRRGPGWVEAAGGEPSPMHVLASPLSSCAPSTSSTSSGRWGPRRGGGQTWQGPDVAGAVGGD